MVSMTIERVEFLDLADQRPVEGGADRGGGGTGQAAGALIGMPGEAGADLARGEFVEPVEGGLADEPLDGSGEAAVEGCDGFVAGAVEARQIAADVTEGGEKAGIRLGLGAEVAGTVDHDRPADHRHDHQDRDDDPAIDGDRF